MTIVIAMKRNPSITGMKRPELVSRESRCNIHCRVGEFRLLEDFNINVLSARGFLNHQNYSLTLKLTVDFAPKLKA